MQAILAETMRLEDVLTKEASLRVRPLQTLRHLYQQLANDIIIGIYAFLNLLSLTLVLQLFAFEHRVFSFL